MCGIAGILRFDGELAHRDVAAVLRMIDAQVHRGPDDWGFLVPDLLLDRDKVRRLLETRGMDHVSVYPSGPGRPTVIIGRTRLAILDLSARGRMPMGKRPHLGDSQWRNL